MDGGGQDVVQPVEPVEGSRDAVRLDRYTGRGQPRRVRLTLVTQRVAFGRSAYCTGTEILVDGGLLSGPGY